VASANHLHLEQQLITPLFTGPSSWRPTNSVKAVRMLICWIVNTSFKPQGCGHYSTNCCYLSTAFGRM